MFNLGKFGATVELDTSQFDAGMRNIDNKTKKATGGLGGFAKSVAKIASGIGVFKVIEKGFGMIVGSVDRAISRVDTLQQFPKVLQQMGYSAEEAQRATDTLAKGIDGLPTTLDEITGTTQRMVNVFQDVDKSADSAVALNNAFLASGASADEASRGTDQYIKMLSTGKVNLDSFTTLQETMPYALQETAEAFGYTGKTAQMDFYDALKSGEVTLDEFNDKMIELSDKQGGFADVAIEATKGIRTSWTNIQTAIANGVAKVITAFDSFLESRGLNGIAGVMDNIKIIINNTFDNVVVVVGVVLEWFGKLYDKVAESTAWNSLKEVVSLVIESIQNLWEKFSETSALETVYDLLVDLADALLDIDFMEIAEDVMNFLDTWSPLIAGITAGVLAFKLITMAQSLWTASIVAWTAVTSIATAVGTAFGAVIAFITSPIGIVVIAIGALIAIGVLLYKNWETVKEFAFTIWNSIATFFSSFWEGTKSLFTSAINVISTGVKSGFNAMKSVITSVINAIKSVITTVWNAIKSVIITVVNAITNGVKSGFNSMKSAVTSVFNAVRSVASSVWNGIRSVITSIVRGIVNAVRVSFNSMRSTVSSIFNGIRSTATSVFNGVKNAITNPVETAKNTVKRALDAIKGFFAGLKGKLKITIPKPKIPKFSLKGSFSLKPPRVPTIGVNWNAKGGIFNKPTIFNTANAGLQGVGEAGSEAILPLNTKVLGGIGKGIASTMQGSNNNQEVALLKEQNQLLRKIASKDNNTYLDGKDITNNVNDRQGTQYNINNFIAGNR